MASFSETEWQPQYLPTDDIKKVRLIGIEFEAKIKPVDEVPEDFKFLTEEKMDELNVGYDIGEYDEYDEDGDQNLHEMSRTEYMENELNELGFEFGGIGYDGGGKEIVTMPDSFNIFETGGSERLIKIVNMLKAATKADKASGTHIHVSKLDSDVKTTWQNVYWFCMCFGPQLQKIFGRITHWARTPLPQNFFTSNDNTTEKLFEAPKKQPKAAGVYAKGSIVVDKGDRYEFRGPKASHDLDEILAWTELCHSIIEVCAKGYIQDVPFSDVLRGKYIRAYVNKIGKNNPDRKLSPAERAMRISEIGYVKVSEKDRLL